MATIVLRRGRAKPFWYGHPWVFSEAIERVDGAPVNGDEVTVTDCDRRFIARGFLSERSQLRVRLAWWRDEPLDAAWFAARLDDAIALRAALGLPSAETDAYRLVNSEGDNLPGLIVDRYGEDLVVQLGTFAMHRRQAELAELLAARLRARAVYSAGGGGHASAEGFEAEPRVLCGESRPRVACREHGLKLEIEPLAGQKTGAFLDQRDNRRRVAELARGRRVLDLYCYVGGFGLHAARAGAAAVVGVDASARALERARAHFADNGLPAPELVESDAFRYLEQVTPSSFDVVVCDPPKFARAKKDLEAARKGYTRLNALALAAVRPGGFLATASCSQLVGAEDFERIVAAAAKEAHRHVRVLELRGQGPDHVVPAAFPEGRYLKLLLCQVYD